MDSTIGHTMKIEHLEPRQMLTLALLATPGDDVIETGPGWARINGEEYRADAIEIDALGGRDVVIMHDSPSDDTLIAGPDKSALCGVEVRGGEIILAYARGGGQDRAVLHDTPGNDNMLSVGEIVKLWDEGVDFYLRTKFFDDVEAIASDGIDVAQIVDSPGDDVAHMEPGAVTMFSPELGNRRATAFDAVHCYAKEGGYDVAHLEGDRFTVRPVYTRAFGDGFVNRAKFFEQTSPGVADTPERVVGDTITMTGAHVLRHSIKLKSGDTLTGDATLTRPDRVQVDLTETADAGTTVLHVTAAPFQVGDELGVFAYGQHGSWVTVTEVGADWVSIDAPLDQSFEAGSALTNYFPLVRGVGEFITIEGLTFDGNHDLTTLQWQIGGGGLIHLEADYSTVRNVTVIDAFSAGIVLSQGRGNRIEDSVVTRSRGHGIALDREVGTVVTGNTVTWSGYLVDKRLGDGIIVNGGADHEITWNTTSHNRQYGLHPAGLLTTGGVWSHNTVEHNGSNGFHFCWNNFDLTVSHNTIRYNGRSGIGGLGLGGEYGDRFNEIHDNLIVENGRYAIEQNGGEDNRIFDNLID